MLSDEDRAVLDLAAENIPARGVVAREIRRGFGWSPTRYFQRLDRLVHTRSAIERDPMTTRRIRELVDD